jgi:hypothetical protein
MSSGGYWDEYSDASECIMERHRDSKHNRRTIAQIREESYAKSLSEQQSEEEEDFVQETPEAALVAAQAYLLTMQPEPGDPREHIDIHSLYLDFIPTGRLSSSIHLPKE